MPGPSSTSVCCGARSTATSSSVATAGCSGPTMPNLFRRRSRSRLRFSQPELGRVDANIRAVRDRFAQCGLPVVVVVIPNKQTIYGKYLFGDNVAAPVTRFDTVLRELSEPARSIMIDPRPTMRTAAAAHDPVLLYPKTETHWNELGAFYGYRAIMTALARSIPIDHPETLSLEHYNVKPFPYAGGDM